MDASSRSITNQIVERLLNHATDVLALLDYLPRTSTTKQARAQLPRSVTSIGANYEEAQAAESKNDFLHKLQIALKEARESCYWLKLLERSGAIPKERTEKVIQESLEIRAILTKAVVTTKKRYGNGNNNGT